MGIISGQMNVFTEKVSILAPLPPQLNAVIWEGRRVVFCPDQVSPEVLELFKTTIDLGHIITGEDKLDRAVDFELLRPFMDLCSAETDVPVLVTALMEVESNDRVEVMKGAQKLKEKCRSAQELGIVIRRFAELGEKQATVLSRLDPFLALEIRGYEVKVLFQALAEANEMVLEKIHPLIPLLKNATNCVALLRNATVDGLDRAAPFFAKCEKNFARVMMCLEKLSADDQRTAREYLENCHNSNDVLALFCLIKERSTYLEILVGRTPLDVIREIDRFCKDRPEILRKVRQLVHCDVPIGLGVVELIDLLGHAEFTQLHFDQESIQLSLADFWKISRYTEQLTQLVLRALDSSEHAVVVALTNKITVSHEDWGIATGHPVVEKLYEVMTVVHDRDTAKDPYSLFSKLREFASNSREIEPPIEEYQGKQARFCPERIHTKIREISVSREDIPAAITQGMWREMTQKVLEKIRAQPKALNAIADGGRDAVVSTLESHYLKSLLRFDGEISLTQLQFAYILMNLLETPDAEESYFSPREEQLIRLAYNVQECEISKDQVIAKAYLMLPKHAPHLRATEERQQNRKAEFIGRFVSDFFYHKLMLDNPVLRSILGNEVAEEPTQKRYLANIIGPAIGLPHSIRFDLHTQLLRDELFGLDFPALVKKFYSFVKPSMLVEALCQIVNNDIATISPLLNLPDDSWEFDDQINPSLGSRGALEFLVNEGFISLLPT